MSSNSSLPSLSAMFASITAGVAGTLVYNFLRNVSPHVVSFKHK